MTAIIRPREVSVPRNTDTKRFARAHEPGRNPRNPSYSSCKTAGISRVAAGIAPTPPQDTQAKIEARRTQALSMRQAVLVLSALACASAFSPTAVLPTRYCGRVPAHATRRANSASPEESSEQTTRCLGRRPGDGRAGRHVPTAYRRGRRAMVCLQVALAT